MPARGGALRPGQLVAMVVAVALAVAVMSGAFFARSMVTTTVRQAVEAVVAADAYVLPAGTTLADAILAPDSQRPYLNSGIVANVAAVREIDTLMPVYLGPAVLVDGNGAVVSSGRAPSVALSADEGGVEAGVYEGRLPTSPKEVALEAATAQRAGLAIGDAATLVAKGSTLPVTVTGIVDYGAPLGGAVVVVVNRSTARALFSPSELVAYVGVKARSGIAPADLAAALTTGLPPDPGTQVVVGEVARQAAVDRVDQSLRWLDVALAGVGLAGLLAAGVLVANLGASAQRRRREDCLAMKTAGATTGQVMAPLLRAGLVSGLIGGVAGVALGAVAVVALRAGTGGFGFEWVMGWPWLGLALALVLGVAVAVLGIWAGAWRAATAPLVSRPTKSADFRWSVVRLVLGALVLAGGITAVVLGLGPTAPLMLGLGLVGALVGMYLVCPVIIVALGYLFGALTGLVAGIGTRLARLDLRRRPARAGNVAGVFVITLALATTALILSGSARDGLRTTLEQDVKADFVVTADVADQALSDSAVSEIRQVPDTHVLSLGLAPARLVLPDQTDPVEARVMYGPAELFSFVDTPVLEGNMTGLATGAAVTRDFAEAHGLALGDELAFVVSQGTPFEEQSTLPVGLIIDSWLYRDVLVPSSWLTPLVPGPARSQLMPATLVLASATNPANQVQLGGAIEAVADAYHRMQVQSGADFAAQSQPAADVIQLAGYVLVAVGVLVTGLAMALALGRSVAERREMIGLLKALGASRGQVQAGVVIESILVSAGGALLGIGLGIAVAWLVPAGVVGLPLAGLTLPWLWLVGLLVAAIVVGLVAPLSAAHQAARTPTLGLAA